MTNATQWHKTPEAQEILASFAKRPPAVRTGRQYGYNRGMRDYTFYVGRRVERLEKIHSEAGNAALALSDAGDVESFRRFMDQPRPEDVITAVIEQVAA